PTPGGSYSPASALPLALSVATRCLPSASMSSLVPNCRHPVGHALTHAGSMPTLTRSTHSVHLAILPVSAWNWGTSNGQPVAQRPQPMHASGLTSTMPFSYCTIAPGAGHALRQPGSAQCMHWSLRISQDSAPLRSSSRNLIRFQKLASSFGIVWYVPVCLVDTSCRSFHSWHATSQALQPMQVVVSMNLDTTGRLRMPVLSPGSAAERCRISS